jgi:hypothetical protein
MAKNHYMPEQIVGFASARQAVRTRTLKHMWNTAK